MKDLSKLWTKSSEEIDTIFKEKSDSVASRIDCLTCANCCKTISPIIEPEEISVIQNHLKIDGNVLFEKYIEMDEDGDFVFKIQPCPMLNLMDNKCSIYEIRPQACRSFPHTNIPQMKAYSDLLEKNYDICPIVSNIVDEIALEINKK
jgi:uncharacterized protein